MEQGFKRHVGLEAGDGLHFLQHGELPVRGEAVGADGHLSARLDEAMIVGHAVFYVEIGVGASGPEHITAPGLGSANVFGGSHGIVHEEDALCGVQVFHGVIDGVAA